MDNKTLLLASASPRRRELLEQAGVKFEIVNHDFDEAILENELPLSAVERIARHKAEDVAQRFPDRIVLAADTIVVLEKTFSVNKDRILGKPGGSDEAILMLNDLQARKHLVITAFCLRAVTMGINVVRAVTSVVEFRSLSAAEIDAYVKTGEPLDKAGAYAVQGKGGVFVKSIQGSYSNIVGLPICEVIEELKRYDLWMADYLI